MKNLTFSIKAFTVSIFTVLFFMSGPSFAEQCPSDKDFSIVPASKGDESFGIFGYYYTQLPSSQTWKASDSVNKKWSVYIPLSKVDITSIHSTWATDVDKLPLPPAITTDPKNATLTVYLIGDGSSYTSVICSYGTNLPTKPVNIRGTVIEEYSVRATLRDNILININTPAFSNNFKSLTSNLYMCQTTSAAPEKCAWEYKIPYVHLPF